VKSMDEDQRCELYRYNDADMHWGRKFQSALYLIYKGQVYYWIRKFNGEGHWNYTAWLDHTTYLGDSHLCRAVRSHKALKKIDRLTFLLLTKTSHQVSPCEE